MLSPVGARDTRAETAELRPLYSAQTVLVQLFCGPEYRRNGLQVPSIAQSSSSAVIPVLKSLLCPQVSSPEGWQLCKQNNPALQLFGLSSLSLLIAGY